MDLPVATAAPVEIVVQAPVEKHDVREEIVEHVARLLARADGFDPDEDLRCHLTGGETSTIVGSQTLFCDLNVFPRPRWQEYRDRATDLIRKAIK
jgi:hypothetical protein